MTAATAAATPSAHEARPRTVEGALDRDRVGHYAYASGLSGRPFVMRSHTNETSNHHRHTRLYYVTSDLGIGKLENAKPGEAARLAAFALYPIFTIIITELESIVRASSGARDTLTIIRAAISAAISAVITAGATAENTASSANKRHHQTNGHNSKNFHLGISHLFRSIHLRPTTVDSTRPN